VLVWILTGFATIWVLVGLRICWMWREWNLVDRKAAYWLLGPFFAPLVLLFLSASGPERNREAERQHRWHCFISYTTREEEVQEVKPFLDAYVRAIQAQGVTVCPVFYDGWYLQRESYSQRELAEKLREGIEGSAFTVAFLSPSYPQSAWCCYEWATTEEVHVRRAPPAPAYSILPIQWKGAITHGWCLRGLETRRWVSIDISDPASMREAVEQTLAFAKEWNGTR